MNFSYSLLWRGPLSIHNFVTGIGHLESIGSLTYIFQMLTHYSVSKIHTLKLHYCDLRKIKLLESGQTSSCCIQVSKFKFGNKYYLLVVFLKVTGSLCFFLKKYLPRIQAWIICQFFFQGKVILHEENCLAHSPSIIIQILSSRQAAILLEGAEGALCVLPIQFSSASQSCPTPCDCMNCSMPGLPVPHQLLEPTQTHVHWVGDAIQPSHPLSSLSPPALSLSQHQGLFKWVSSSHQVSRVLEFQLQHQWLISFRMD